MVKSYHTLITDRSADDTGTLLPVCIVSSEKSFWGIGVFFTFCFISSEGEIRLVGLVVGVNVCFAGLDFWLLLVIFAADA